MKVKELFDNIKLKYVFIEIGNKINVNINLI